MPSIIIINDIQIKSTQPYFDATRDFLRWVVEQSWNNESNYLWLNGDIYEHSNPSNEEQSAIHEFLNKCKFKKVYLLEGNHDKSWNSKSALKPLASAHTNVEVIDFPTILKLGNLNILGLPHMMPFELSDNLTMKSFYENLPEEFTKETYDLCLGHYEDHKVAFKGKGINTSYLNVKKYYHGHLHLYINEEYQGVPVIRTYAEVGQHNKLLMVDTITKENSYIEVPKFLDFVNVEYPNDLNDTNWKYPIYNIKNCPNKKMAKSLYAEKYKSETKYIREYEVIKKDRSISGEVESNKGRQSINEYFSDYRENIELNDEVIKLVNEGIE